MGMLQAGAPVDAERILKRVDNALPSNPGVLYLLGICASLQEKKEQAISLYNRVIRLHPLFVEAYNNKGLDLHCLGKNAEAVASFEEAIKIRPDFVEAYMNLGVALNEMARHEEALQKFEFALHLRPISSEALTAMSVSLVSLKRYSEAESALLNAVQINPLDFKSYCNLGVIYATQKKYDQAVAAYEKSIAINPEYSDAYNNLGVALFELKRYEDGLLSYQKALEIKPDYADVYNNLGVAFNELKRHEDAVASCLKALELKPGYADAYLNLGAAFIGDKRYREGLEAYQNALNFKADFSGAYNNMGWALLELRRYDESLAAYNKAIELDSESAAARFGRSALNLSLGNLEKGWTEYEFRWEKDGLNLAKLQTTRPRWDGSRTDKRLLVWSEQGVGDQILFCTTLREVIKIAPNLIVRINPKLLPIYEKSFPSITFVPHDEVVNETEFEIHTPMGDLPKFLRRDLVDFENQVMPYLLVNESIKKDLLYKLPTKSFMVGLSWGTTGKDALERSLPLERLICSLKKQGVNNFVDLQYTDTYAERAIVRESLGVDILKLESVDSFNDLESLAALIDCCDVVVTCDNTTAHLAGALGKETHVLLPYSRGLFWYWSYKKDGHSLWYPSVRLHQQVAMDDWSVPFAELDSEIRAK